MTEYFEAEVVRAMAMPILQKLHPHLLDAHILYKFADRLPNRQGARVWGQMRKLSSFERALMPQPADFVMVISHEMWGDLTPEQQVALIDHELCHATTGKHGDFAIRSHDLEEFGAIVRRHGLWRDNVQQFALEAVPALEQLSLLVEASGLAQQEGEV